MLTFVSIVHVLLCVFMIFVILLQPGKDAGMGAALGGGAATSAFGGRGAVTFLSKVTAVCATGFFLTALGLSFVGMRRSVAAEGGGGTPTPGAAAVVDAGTPTTTLEQEAGGAAPAAALDAGSAAVAPGQTGATSASGGAATQPPAAPPADPKAPAPAPEKQP